MDNNKIGKFIALKRKEKNLTQQELGEKLFVTDKAVSKWERGLSLPDVALLGKLANVLDTDIYDILQIEKQEESNVDIEKILEEEKVKIKKQLIKRILVIFVPIVIIICIILFKLIPFGYNIEHVRYNHNTDKLIDLGIPKFSFFMKNTEDSYSYKNLRGKKVLKSEVKEFLGTLDHISCYDKIYYYNSISNTTIIDYKISGNPLYNNISYSVRNGNYCDALKLNEYSKKLGKLNTNFILYGEDNNISVEFLPRVITKNNENEYNASLLIRSISENKILEKSSGTFEIDNDILTYKRTNSFSENNIAIPLESKFVIKKNNLILKDNYLSDYVRSITLR